MAKRKPRSKQPAKPIDEATRNTLIGAVIFQACGKAAETILQEDHGFTKEQVDEFVKKMIPLAVMYGSQGMGVNPEQYARKLADVFASLKQELQGDDSGEPVQQPERE